MKSLVLAWLALAATTGMANAQDLAAGEQAFRKCSPCHSVGEDARNKVGPVLNGLDGRKSGTVADCASADVADDLVRQAVQQGVRRGLFERPEVNAALRRARRERDAAPKLRKP